MEILNLIKQICIENIKVLIVVVSVVITDTITGSAKAIKNDNFTFNSSGMRKLLPKSMMYFGWIFLGIMLEFGFSTPNVTVPTTLIFSGVVILIELKSIKENLDEIPEMGKVINWVLNIVSKRTDTDKYIEDVISNDYEEIIETEYNEDIGEVITTTYIGGVDE